MPTIPALELPQEDPDIYNCKAAVVSAFDLHINTDLLHYCSEDSATYIHSDPEETTRTTKRTRREAFREWSSNKKFKALPTLDPDLPSVASTAIASSTTSTACSGSNSTASKRSSFSWGRRSPDSAPHIIAQIDESVTTCWQLGDASISGDFASIEYGLYNNRPACAIIVDFRLVFQPSSTIKWARCEFQFGCSATDAPTSRASTAFYPDELNGQYDTAEELRSINPEIGVAAYGFKAGISGTQQQTRTKRRHWRVQGHRIDHSGIYDTFCWEINGNEFSEDSVPRHFRTGMIVYLPPDSTNREGWVDVTIDGSLRGVFPRHKTVREQRYFRVSPAQLGCQNILDAMRLRCRVEEVNMKISDLAPSKQGLEPAILTASDDNNDVPEKTRTQREGQIDFALHLGTVISHEVSPTEDWFKDIGSPR